MRIKLHENDRMVEIPINQMTHYKNRMHVELVINTHTMEKSEHDSELLAEEVVLQLIGILKDRIMYDDNAPYGVEIVNYGVNVIETEIVEDGE